MARAQRRGPGVKLTSAAETGFYSNNRKLGDIGIDY